MQIKERFIDKSLDPNFKWFCEPETWSIDNEQLTISTDAETDFWQKTHYGFQVDNGHFLYAELSQDFVLETEVRSNFVNQYDQAGLMIRVSEDCWMKTAIEYEPDESNKLGAVVTNQGYSDWSTQDVDDSLTKVKFKVIRKGSDYILQCFDQKRMEWSQLRMFHLNDSSKVMAGIYCCSPKSAGFSAQFSYLTID